MERRVDKAQNISRMCMVCGTENKAGLNARFYEIEGGELVGLFEPREEHQSYPGRMHGGVSSAILDETIGRAINISDPDAWGVTVELSMRFRKPVPLNGPVRAIARITRNTRKIFEGSGEILLDDGTVAVEATGRYMKLPADKIADAAFCETDWFADARPEPNVIDI